MGGATRPQELCRGAFESCGRWRREVRAVGRQRRVHAERGVHAVHLQGRVRARGCPGGYERRAIDRLVPLRRWLPVPEVHAPRELPVPEVHAPSELPVPEVHAGDHEPPDMPTAVPTAMPAADDATSPAPSPASSPACAPPAAAVPSVDVPITAPTHAEEPAPKRARRAIRWADPAALVTVWEFEPESLSPSQVKSLSPRPPPTPQGPAAQRPAQRPAHPQRTARRLHERDLPHSGEWHEQDLKQDFLRRHWHRPRSSIWGIRHGELGTALDLGGKLGTALDLGGTVLAARFGTAVGVEANDEERRPEHEDEAAEASDEGDEIQPERRPELRSAVAPLLLGTATMGDSAVLSAVRRLRATHTAQPQGGSRSGQRESLGLLRRRAALGTALALKAPLPSLQLAQLAPACAERPSKPALGTTPNKPPNKPALGTTPPAGSHHAAGGSPRGSPLSQPVSAVQFSPRGSPLSQPASAALEPPHMQLDGARDGARDSLSASDGARDGAPSPQPQPGVATGAPSPQTQSASRPSSSFRPMSAASRGHRHLNAAAAAAGGVQGGVAVEGYSHVAAAGVPFPLSTAACASPSVGGKRPFNYLYLQPQQPQAQYMLSRGAKLAAATSSSGGASRL